MKTILKTVFALMAWAMCVVACAPTKQTVDTVHYTVEAVFADSTVKKFSNMKIEELRAYLDKAGIKYNDQQTIIQLIELAGKHAQDVYMQTHHPDPYADER